MTKTNNTIETNINRKLYFSRKFHIMKIIQQIQFVIHQNPLLNNNKHNNYYKNNKQDNCLIM